MQSFTVDSYGRIKPRTGRAFLARILLAHLRGLTPDEFAEEELARMQAERGAIRDEPETPDEEVI